MLPWRVAGFAPASDDLMPTLNSSSNLEMGESIGSLIFVYGNISK
jgi:hypothetical protein